MKKPLIILLIIIIILIAVGAYSFLNFKNQEELEIASDINFKQNDAILHYESGEIYLNGNLISSDKNLKQNDIIETKNGLASIILYKSVIVALEKNTKIILEDILKEHPKIIQGYGETWNKFTNIYGVNSYTIKSGNTIASVRATAFSISKNKIIVGDGLVLYQIDGKLFNVAKYEAVEKIGAEIISRNLTSEEKILILYKEDRILNISNKFDLIYKPIIEPVEPEIVTTDSENKDFNGEIADLDSNLGLVKNLDRNDKSEIEQNLTNQTSTSYDKEIDSNKYDDNLYKTSESNSILNNVKPAQKLS